MPTSENWLFASDVGAELKFETVPYWGSNMTTIPYNRDSNTIENCYDFGSVPHKTKSFSFNNCLIASIFQPRQVWRGLLIWENNTLAVLSTNQLQNGKAWLLKHHSQTGAKMTQ